MPSFLSKVFTRRKDEKDASHPPKRTSVASLLEGKFEAVSPPASPSATNVAHSQSSNKEERREKEKDVGFSLFRARSPRPTSPKTDAVKPELPHLTLNLPEYKGKDARPLGVVFEADVGDRGVLPDNVIGERRLNPSEALSLVKACSTAIVDRGGLETLGVMHPHWYSASPDVQRRLISLFLLSLASNSPSTLPASPTTPSALFDTELQYTRSPHDLAAVLRWALRHLRLEGDFFGVESTDAEPWRWYQRFSEAERASSYPSGAFTQFLTPQLPPAHLHLLLATLEIVSSLAAHSDRSGISGSKLSKVLGLWLLTARRAEDNDDWSSFYARWERAGRILEHLLLAQIRDEMTRTKLPRRIVELVAGYPYLKNGEPAGDLLPQPRLSTRMHSALYVRLETQLPDFLVQKPKQPPQQIIADAAKAEGALQAGQYGSLWELLKQQAAATEKTALSTDDDTSPALGRLFTDETARLFFMLPSEGPKSEATTIKLEIPEPRGRSRSVGAGQNGVLTNGTSRATASTTDLSPKDWTDFSSLGFGESTLGQDFAATLMDNDLEVTEPPLVRRKSSKRQKASAPLDAPAASRTVTLPSKCALINVIQVDEAFIDFWSDALFDPIASNWPNFVICQLKPIAGFEANGTPLNWLIIEQVFTRPPPPPEPESLPVLQRAASPKPSLRSNISGRKSVTFSNAKKRFTLFSQKENIASLDARLSERKKTGTMHQVGEMGEILSEEPETQQTDADKPESEAKGSEQTSNELTTGVAASAAAGTTSAAHPEDVNVDLPPVPIVEVKVHDTEAATSVSPVKSDEEPAEKSTKFVEHITPPANTTPASSEVAAEDVPANPKQLPPAPEPVVLAGETPGPDVALSTSEPMALAEASARAEAIPEVLPTTEQVAAVDGPSLVAEAEVHPVPEATEAEAVSPAADAAAVVPETVEHAPQDVKLDIAVAEPPVGLVSAESKEELPVAIPVGDVPAVTKDEVEPPATVTEIPVDAATDVEPPAPLAESVPEVLSTEEESTAGELVATDGESHAEEPVVVQMQEPIAPGENTGATAEGTDLMPGEDVVTPLGDMAVSSPEGGAVPPLQEVPVEASASHMPEDASSQAIRQIEETALGHQVRGAPSSSEEPTLQQSVHAADEPRNGSAHEDKADDSLPEVAE